MSRLGSVDIHDFILLKENIQPLRRDGDTSVLCPTFNFENNVKCQQELEERKHEFEIGLNNSDDPLYEWWTLNCPIDCIKGQGKDGKLKLVLKKCINKFRDSEKYRNDSRFSKLCIQYALMEGNTLELLSEMHRHGIGVLCAELYITWAEKYVTENCFKKANAVYEKGLQCRAQPLKLLEEAYKNFQAFLLRKMINCGEIFQPTVLHLNIFENFQPYSISKSEKIGQKDVASVQAGQNITNTPKKVQQIKDQKLIKAINIHQDSEKRISQTGQKAKLEKVQGKKGTKENGVKPLTAKFMPGTVVSSGFPFQVHRDEGDVESERKCDSTVKPCKIKECNGYEDENFEKAPLFYSEPPDPTKVSMYCKEQVYAGGLEFQFEELRAVQFRRKREEIMNRIHSVKPPETPIQKTELHSQKDLKKSEIIERRKLELRKMKMLSGEPLPLQTTKSLVPELENKPASENLINHSIHTKEPFNEFKQIWFPKTASPLDLAKPFTKSILKPCTPRFGTFEYCLSSESPEKPLDLTFKRDKSLDVVPSTPQSVVKKKTVLPTPIKSPRENEFVQKQRLFKTEYENLDKIGKLEEEVQNSFIRWNATEITETLNFTKGFQFPLGESTPNVRKSILKKDDFNDSMFVPERRKHSQNVTPKREEKKQTNDKTILIKSISKKLVPKEDTTFTKNLSVIPETSREYRSSSSGSSNLSVSALHHPKLQLNTSLESKSYQIVTPKLKLQNSLSNEVLKELNKTPRKERLSIAYDLMNKLKIISNSSINLTKQDSSPGEITKLKVEAKEAIDPFDEELIEKLLKKAEFPKTGHLNGYFVFDSTDLPPPKVNSTLVLGPEKFDVKGILEDGSYSGVFKLLNNRSGDMMSGKYSKTKSLWEFYIAREIQSRIQDKSLVLYFTDVHSAYFFRNCSFLLCPPVQFITLLSIIKKMKQAQMMCQDLAVYFATQILKIVETLHSCKIIHGNIHPENFLLRNYTNRPQLQLTNFTKSIDMTLFPEGTTFNTVTATDVTVIDAREGKTWTYHIDLYGVANCAHYVLFGEPMKVIKKQGVWGISKIIHRYWAKMEWKNFFLSLLNIESPTKPPNLSELGDAFNSVLEDSLEIDCTLERLKNILQLE